MGTDTLPTLDRWHTGARELHAPCVHALHYRENHGSPIIIRAGLPYAHAHAMATRGGFYEAHVVDESWDSIVLTVYSDDYRKRHHLTEED
jgi:hypothetical protein